MLVTSIEEVSKSRSKIFIDGEFAFVLYKGELRFYKVAVGEEISESAYDEILQVVLPKRAKLRAMNLLQKREYTEKQLRDKLREGGYPGAVIEMALQYVANYHYTDDLRYAVTYITDHESSRSRKRIEQDLFGKGIPKEILQKAWLEWEEQGGMQDEEEMIRRLLEKRHYVPGQAEPREEQKTFMFLMRKGFSTGAIRRVMHSEIADYCE